jgi:hypothetical protein
VGRGRARVLGACLHGSRDRLAARGALPVVGWKFRHLTYWRWSRERGKGKAVQKIGVNAGTSSERSKERRPVGALLFCLTAYAIVLACLLPKRSLWMDEILDLMGARLQNLPDLLRYVRANPGAVPLGYIVQGAALRMLGVSSFAGRLPSALSSLASCAGVYLLARRAALKWPLLAAVAFIACPLQLRYALEARGYALALALSIYSTLFFFLIRENPSFVKFRLLYAGCVIAGIYTQPYSVFVPFAHIFFTCFDRPPGGGGDVSWWF